MQANMQLANDTLEVRLGRRLTFEDHERFRTILKEYEGSAAKRLVFDMASLEYIDSAGLGMLLIARERADECNGRLALLSPKGHVAKVLRLSKFDTLMDISW